MREAGFGSAAEAAGVLDASLDYLTAMDWASLGTEGHGEMLARLQRAQSRLTAVSAAVLAAFTAQAGYEPDGHRSARAWLVNRTGISAGAASGAVGWQKRLGRHGRIGAVLAAGDISESWARQIAKWTDRLPGDKRDDADHILLDAAASGLPLEDLAILARNIDETWKAQHRDPDDGNGDSGDEDGFGDRSLRLGTTLDGVGKLTGDLTAGCAAALQAIFDSLGRHLGPEDHRSIDQRHHDALAEALHRLIRAGLLPDSAGQATLAQVLIDFADLRRLPGSSALAMAADAMSGPDGLTYHHQVCVHRLRWTLILHADGTTEARSPHGEVLRSHGPPSIRAG